MAPRTLARPEGAVPTKQTDESRSRLKRNGGRDRNTASELNTDVSVHAIWNPREAQQDLMAVEYFCDHGLWEDEMFFLFTYP